MSSKVVVIVVFVALFLSLVALLVCLALYAYDETREKHQDTVASEHVMRYDTNWQQQVNLSCSQCTKGTTLIGLFCDNQRFVIVADIINSIESNDIDVQLFRFSHVKILKQITHLIDALTSKVIAVRTFQSPDERCEPSLFDTKRYLLTGYISQNLIAVVTACDLIVDWSTLTIERQHEFASFSQRTKCVAINWLMYDKFNYSPKEHIAEKR